MKGEVGNPSFPVHSGESMNSHNSNSEMRKQTFAIFLKNALQFHSPDANAEEKKHQMEIKIGNKCISCLRRVIDF